jgi:hypothetical protein
MQTTFGIDHVSYRKAMLLRLVLGGLIALTVEIWGAESTNGLYAQKIAEWVALPKPRDPSVDDRVFR